MTFESWYQGFHGSLLAALTVVAADREVAADVAHEVFLRALERWDRVESMSSPEGWAYRVGVNLLRRRLRRAMLERKLLGRPVSSDPPELAWEVWAAVKALSPRQREAIALRYLLGMSEAEVAEAMGVAVGTASATLAAARTRLAGLLASDNTMEVDT